MKGRSRFALLILLMSISSLDVIIAQSISLMSYNIKNDYQKEGPDTWNHRRVAMNTLLHLYEPKILGVQEALLNQLSYLDSCLTAYKYIGVGRDDGIKAGEYCAIFYNIKQYCVLKDGTFWLSESPQKVSKGWDAAYPRICTYALFQNRSSAERFWVFNTHFDHKGIKAREESAKLILATIKQLNSTQYPVIVMGDMNATPDEFSIQLFNDELNDTYWLSEKACTGPVGTFNGFSQAPVERRIDYIFTDDIIVKSYRHISDRRQDNSHVSDHLPVLISVELQ